MQAIKLGTVAATLAALLLGGSFFAGRVSADEETERVPAPHQTPLAKANNEFGIDLFKRLHTDGKNTFISPTSIAMAMQMVAQGAGGETRKELDKAMGIGDIDAGKANKELIADLNGRDGVNLNVANSFWADTRRISLNGKYVSGVQDNFGGDIKLTDFDNPATVGEINKWAALKTKGLIDKVVQEIPGDEVSLLINAIYFKGSWSVPFKKKDTKDAEFTLKDASTKTVKMMSRSDHIAYGEADGVQIAKLPYGKNRKAAMWIVLPGKDKSLDKLVGNLTTDKLNNWRARTWKRQGTLKLPRFKLHYSQKINDALKAAGIKRAFDPSAADFTPMGESKLGPLSISTVHHEAVVIVNEEGTEAAAVTDVAVTGSAEPPKPFSMVCDRPFLFFITDKPTGSILFMGTCYNPGDPDSK